MKNFYQNVKLREIKIYIPLENKKEEDWKMMALLIGACLGTAGKSEFL